MQVDQALESWLSRLTKVANVKEVIHLDGVEMSDGQRLFVLQNCERHTTSTEAVSIFKPKTLTVCDFDHIYVIVPQDASWKDFLPTSSEYDAIRFSHVKLTFFSVDKTNTMTNGFEVVPLMTISDQERWEARALAESQIMPPLGWASKEIFLE